MWQSCNELAYSYDEISFRFGTGRCFLPSLLRPERLGLLLVLRYCGIFPIIKASEAKAFWLIHRICWPCEHGKQNKKRSQIINKESVESGPVIFPFTIPPASIFCVILFTCHCCIGTMLVFKPEQYIHAHIYLYVYILRT